MNNHQARPRRRLMLLYLLPSDELIIVGPVLATASPPTQIPGTVITTLPALMDLNPSVVHAGSRPRQPWSNAMEYFRQVLRPIYRHVQGGTTRKELPMVMWLAARLHAAALHSYWRDDRLVLSSAMAEALGPLESLVYRHQPSLRISTEAPIFGSERETPPIEVEWPATQRRRCGHTIEVGCTSAHAHGGSTISSDGRPRSPYCVGCCVLAPPRLSGDSTGIAATRVRRVDSDRAHCRTTWRTQRSHSRPSAGLLVEKGALSPQMLVLIVG